MPRLGVARGEQIRAIYNESHALWGGGLSVDGYRGFWQELTQTPWARKHLTFVVWLDRRDRVLSSLKLYRPRVRVLEHTGRACFLGAVFTPRTHRGRGHAHDMMRAVLRQARDRGDEPAMLFSDIGTRYYAALGFRALPAEETVGRVSRAGGRPPAGWEFRALRPDDDLPLLERFHEDWCRTRPLAILRDHEHWQFLLTRVHAFFSRIDDPYMVPRFRIATRRGEVLGYLFTVEGHGEWSVREVGARGGDPELMAAILRVGLAASRGAGLRRIYGWLPGEVAAALDDWKLQRRPRSRAIPMLLSLDGAIDARALQSADESFLPYQDQF